ncbi:MAG: hypothetical protein WCY51_07475 [Sulfurimonas sp.]|uniref:hypothetical protein n=1 Tax=Sulfurimonas sp. TaxID=2022749 RepID=UPI0025F0A9DA|nr:hypothetical protein [Sulfurimonas sp.]MCK9455532.1 hypothetical protein [Sulfurimonas sp.]
MDIRKLLNGIGIKVFVEYFQYFNNLSYEVADIIEILPSKYTEKSRRSRISKARTLIKENRVQEALDYILESQRISEEIKNQAVNTIKA